MLGTGFIFLGGFSIVGLLFGGPLIDMLNPRKAILFVLLPIFIGILILLEATRRAIGMPLVIIAICFLLFSYFGKYAPDIISHGGLSVKRLVGFQWFDQEAIFGIPIGVSVDFIFLFVLFGALLETAGGGKYFLDLAFATVSYTHLTLPTKRIV